MDARQIEEYRSRMQARYQSHGRNPAVSSPPSVPQRPASRVDEDERLARQLQEEEQRKIDEEYAKKLQSEDSRPPEVPPPANIQREERLVESAYPRYAPEPARPLLPVQHTESCWPESETCCGFSDQFCIWVLALGLAGAIVSGLLVLIYKPK